MLFLNQLQTDGRTIPLHRSEVIRDGRTPSWVLKSESRQTGRIGTLLLPAGVGLNAEGNDDSKHQKPADTEILTG